MDFQKALEAIGKVNKEELKPVVGITAATLVALYTLYTLNKGPSIPAGLSLPPTVGEGNLPYVGHLLSLGELPGHKVAEWHKKYGPIIRVNFGVQSYVMIGDPYLAHEIFSTNGSVTSGRSFHLYTHKHYSINQRGVISANPTKRWKENRTAVLEILAPKNVRQFEELIYYEMDSIVDYLIDKTREKGSAELIKPLQYSTMNVMLQTALAIRAESPDDPLFTETVDIIERGMKMAGVAEDISTFLPILSFLDVITRRERRMKSFIRNERDPHFNDLIKKSREIGKECFLKSLTELQAKNNDIDEDMIMVTINDVLAAGADTTAISISWFLIILCHHPDLQQRLRDEIDDFLKKHKRYPTFDDRANFPLLISVQKECMRYRPTSPFGMPHEATEDLQVRDYFLPKGTVLVSSMIGLHSNEEVYHDADQFIPERFMDNQKSMSASANGPIEARDQYNFGWGRRICPGIHLAEVEMFRFGVSLFAKAVVMPKLDASGAPVFPDINRVHDVGIVLHPVEEGEVRIVPRTDAVKF